MRALGLPSRRTLIWLCLAVFVIRVVAQVEVSLCAPSWLLPFRAWESGLVPYPALLPAQILLIAWMTVIAVDHPRGRPAATHPTGARTDTRVGALGSRRLPMAGSQLRSQPHSADVSGQIHGISLPASQLMAKFARRRYVKRAKVDPAHDSRTTRRALECHARHTAAPRIQHRLIQHRLIQHRLTPLPLRPAPVTDR